MLILLDLLLFCSVVGLLSCTVFLALLAIGCVRFRRRALPNQAPDSWPTVSLLKPLHGLEPGLEANIESFFRQDYPSYELVFGCRHHNDPALAAVELVRGRHPDVAVKYAFSGDPCWPNAKVCSLDKMAAVASGAYLVVSDSDVRVTPSYVRQVVRPLLDNSVGLVTCLYRGVPTRGLWSQLEALGMSVEMTAGVIVA